MERYKRLLDTYRFPGFRPEQTVSGIFGDPKARVIRLVRRGKKRHAERAVLFIIPFTTGRFEGFGTFPAGTCGFTWRWRSDGFIAEGARK
jgi:hypothetical protein